MVKRTQGAKFVSGQVGQSGRIVLNRTDGSTAVCEVVIAVVADAGITVNNDSTVDLTFPQ